MPTTGENEQGLHKILELTRAISIALLILHAYYFFYAAFFQWHLVSVFSDRFLNQVARTGIFGSLNTAKWIALGSLGISLLGAKGKKELSLGYTIPLVLLGTGLLAYFGCNFFLNCDVQPVLRLMLFASLELTGYLLLLAGGLRFTRILRIAFYPPDIFNREAETFPQEERMIVNEYSINFPARYRYKDSTRSSWINITNPFRGTLIMGSPGSGKSYFIIQHILRQHVRKGFALFVYDFKYDELSRIAYNCFLKDAGNYPVPPKFYALHFDDLAHSHRCNPLDKDSMVDIMDAREAAQTVLFGLNQEWIKKPGDFWVESAINFVTALIWFLRSFENGIYCTLPHVIELAQVPYGRLFSVLRSESQIENLMNPFVTAFLNDATEQLEGQIGSARISLAKLAAPNLYYILSGNDFTLDINHPGEPKIVCLGNNPQKTQTYGAVLSLYISSMTRLLTKKDRLKCSLVFDEFPTIYFNGIDKLIATARSSKIATTIAVQDTSQLKLYYSREQAEVITNIVGNLISGQVSGDSAKHLAERFGKIMQGRQNIAVNSNDTTVTQSHQLEYAIPASRIASLSAGEFVGTVADDPLQKMPLKMFCAEILNDHAALADEAAKYRDLPVIREVNRQDVLAQYAKIKTEIRTLIDAELLRMLNTPELENLIIQKS